MGASLSIQPKYPKQVSTAIFTQNITCLPNDILLHIFSYLTVCELARMSFISKQWRQFSQDDRLWSNICKINHNENYLKMFDTPFVKENGWYKTFKLIKGINFSTHSFNGFCLHGPHKMAISMDLFASADLNGIYVHNLITGKKLHFIDNPLKAFTIINLAISRNLLICSYESYAAIYNVNNYPILIWNLDTGAYLSAFKEHTAVVTALAACDNVVVSGSKEGTIKWWNADTQVCIKTISAHVGQVNCLVLCNNYSISAGADGDIKIWRDLSTECFRILHDSKSVNAIASDGISVFSGGDDKMIKIWDLETGTATTLGQHEDKIKQILIQNHLLVSKDDHGVMVMNKDTRVLCDIRNTVIREVRSDEKDASANVYVWDLNSKTCVKKYYSAAPKFVAMQGEVLLIPNKDLFFSSGITLYSLNGYKSLEESSFSKLIGFVKKKLTL